MVDGGSKYLFNSTLPGKMINFDWLYFFKRLETTTFPLEFSERWIHLLSGKNTAKAEEKQAVDVISEFGDPDPQIATSIPFVYLAGDFFTDSDRMGW